MATKKGSVSNGTLPKGKTVKSKAVNATSVKQTAAPSEVRSVGRPNIYKSEFADLAYKFCLLGANNDKLAKLFEVAGSTIDKWIAEIPEFSGKVQEGREIADAEIAHSLFHRAKGYQHSEDDIKMYQGQIIVTPTVKHYPPDTGAATLWLKNRQGDKWRDKTEVDHSGSLTIDKLPDDVLEERMKELFARMQAK